MALERLPTLETPYANFAEPTLTSGSLTFVKNIQRLANEQRLDSRSNDHLEVVVRTSNFEQLKSSARSGCHICSMLRAGLRDQCHTDKGAHELRLEPDSQGCIYKVRKPSSTYCFLGSPEPSVELGLERRSGK